LGGIDHGIHRTAEQAGRVSQDIPSVALLVSITWDPLPRFIEKSPKFRP
jgi:hypothetical protein